MNPVHAAANRPPVLELIPEAVNQLSRLSHDFLRLPTFRMWAQWFAAVGTS